MEAEGDNIIWFNYMGEEGERIPRDATHVFVHARVIPGLAFAYHPNIVEVVCHEDIEKIKIYTFSGCTSWRRVIMPGVEVVEDGAFGSCRALTHVECGKLEIIRYAAFLNCKSLRSIDLTSAAVVERRAFCGCEDLRDAKFSSKLEIIEGEAFHECTSLERITIPLEDGMITADHGTFNECENLKHVDLADGELHETIAALHLEKWRNDMNEEIYFINRILPEDDTIVRFFYHYGIVPGDKADVIRRWIRSVIHKINRYKAKHQRLMDEAASILQLALPHDIVMNSVLPFFLHLPLFSFEWVEAEEEVDESDEEQYPL